MTVTAASHRNTRIPPANPLTRLTALMDDGTMTVLSGPEGCGMVAATGRVHGAPVVAFASDPTVQGGAMSREGCDVVVAAYEKALAASCPIVGIWHSGGARMREGVESLDGVGRVFAAMTRASGRVPQISLALGPAAGGAAYGPA